MPDRQSASSRIHDTGRYGVRGQSVSAGPALAVLVGDVNRLPAGLIEAKAGAALALCPRTPGAWRFDGLVLLRQHSVVQSFKAIAAMSLNRVIGAGGKIPWHLPEDFKWFKQTTTGHVLVMGRKTFDSIGKPLPNRTTVVLSRRGAPIPGTLTISDLNQLDPQALGLGDRQVFICGGAEIYRQALPSCSDLYLTLVKRTVEGDTFFPPFEDQFQLVGELQDCPEFKILHYRRTVSSGEKP